MDWLGRGALGLVLMVAGAAAFGFGLYHLVKTGSCGTTSGGAYEGSFRPCPSTTGWYVGALIAGIFAFLAGGGVFVTRGRHATDPGLPPIADPIHENPPPFSRFYGSDPD
jgi:uncharacterized membrane protein